jgi:DNA-binding MarR family transcriptional regulator
LARALQFLAGSTEPVTPTQLSRELGRSPAATSELIKRLVKTSQITADVDPDDRRSFKLVLTQAGHAKWNEVRGALQQAEAVIEGGYGGGRLEALAGELDELVTALDKVPA